jgi:hypothetical protein
MEKAIVRIVFNARLKTNFDLRSESDQQKLSRSQTKNIDLGLITHGQS